VPAVLCLLCCAVPAVPAVLFSAQKKAPHA